MVHNQSFNEKCMPFVKKVYAVDLDSTLAYHTDWVHHTKIGEPIPAMKAKVLQWLNDGHEVFIFSARLNAEEDIVFKKKKY